MSDDGIFTDEVLQARIDREQKSQRAFELDTAGFTSIADFHTWLHGTHRCYAVTRQNEVDAPTNVDDKALASY